MFQPVGLIWGIVTLIFGILVMVYPNMLRYTVGIYLVIVGIWAVVAKLHLHFGWHLSRAAVVTGGLKYLGHKLRLGDGGTAPIAAPRRCAIRGSPQEQPVAFSG